MKLKLADYTIPYQSKGKRVTDQLKCVDFFDYPRSDKEFRNSLVSSVPAIEPVLKVLLQEEGNAVSQATKSISNATQKVVDAKDTVVGFFGGEKPAPAPASAPAKSKYARFLTEHRL